MKLHWSPRSPFVRKVMIVLHETGLVDRVDYVRSVVAFAAKPNEDVLTDNPLGKIPTLVLDDGTALFDSRVICEYLDTLHDGPKMFPAEGEERFRHLRWLSLGDGMTENLLLWRIERLRSKGPEDVILAAFDTKTRAGFALLEREADALSKSPFGIGHAAIVCTIGQLEFRFAGSRWRDFHPRLATWFDEVSKRPSVIETTIKDDLPPGETPAEPSAPPLVFAETST